MILEEPDLVALSLLVGVQEHGSLGAAARTLGMAESNASRVLARFERRLRLELIHRTPTGSTLTAEGHALIGIGREMLLAGTRLLMTAEALRIGRDDGLDIAASRTIAEFLVPSWFGALRKNSPEVRLRLHVMSSGEVEERVRSGQSTLGFTESYGKPKGVQSTIIGHDRLVLVVPNAHPWARLRSPPSLEQLARTALIAREKTSETRKQVDRILMDRHPVPPAFVLRSSAAVRIAVIAGMGPAITSALTVVDCVRRGELTQVGLPAGPWARYLRALWPRTAVLDPQARRLISIARRSSSLLQDQTVK